LKLPGIFYEFPNLSKKYQEIEEKKAKKTTIYYIFSYRLAIASKYFIKKKRYSLKTYIELL